MKRVVWILPVGLEFERVLASLNQGGNEFYVFYSKTDHKVGSEAQRFAEKVRDYLEAGPFTVKGYEGIDVLDLSACISAFREVLKAEQAEGDDFVLRVNIGASSKIVALAALYAASREPATFEIYYPRAENYLIMDIVGEVERVLEGIPEDGEQDLSRLRQLVDKYHKFGWTTRSDEGYELQSVPIIPMQELSGIQQSILKVLQGEGGMVESSGELAGKLFEAGLTDAAALEGARSSVSFALRDLRDWKFVETESVGRRKRVILTPAGRLYHEIFIG